MTICVRCRVRGRVQGVFFRASTRSQAVALGVNGWVRNLPDGSVELTACGAAAAVEALRDWLWTGPPGAQVTDVRCDAIAPQSFAEFSVRH